MHDILSWKKTLNNVVFLHPPREAPPRGLPWRVGIALVIIAIIFLFSCVNRPVGLGSRPQKIFFNAETTAVPVIRNVEHNPMVRVYLNIPDSMGTLNLKFIRLSLNKDAVKDIESITIYNNRSKKEFDPTSSPTVVTNISDLMYVPVEINAEPGDHYIWLSAKLRPSALLDGLVSLYVRDLTDSKGIKYDIINIWNEGNESFKKRRAVAIRKAGEDGVHTYRIPGLTTTDKGTLIAVYDNRYKTSRDLPGNIDVGMSRSKDGGQTWEPMRVIMDMGEPHENNGVGDPAILFDPLSKKIFVAALWSKGNRSIAGSGPGLTPDETGQLVIVESNDDGITWSAPVSITAQVKNPVWKIFFNGPGNGIVMKDGKLVFPAQYWDSASMPYSTIIYSDDHGRSWKAGTGAKSNTTESQVVEIKDGVLMLSMRDNRGKFRSISTTSDMGATWTEHPTSYNTLEDPVCMAGFMKASMNWEGKARDFLFFSNPASSHGRVNLSVRYSMDLGETWPSSQKVLIDERKSYGYSVMTKIDDNTIGLLYEGTGDLYFVRIPVNSLVSKQPRSRSTY